MSYRGQKKGSYGDNSKHNRFSWGKFKKEKPHETVYVRDPEPKIQPENISWTDRPLPEGCQIFVSRPTTLTANAQRILLPADLTLQAKNASDISLVAATQKLFLEAVTPNGQVKKYRVVKLSAQQPQDKPLEFPDYVYVGNIKNALRNCGFNVVLA